MSGPHTLRLILVLCVLAVSGAGMNPARAEPPRFSSVAPGIGYATFKVRSADAEPFSGHAFRIDLDEAELRLVPAGDPSVRRTVEQIAAPFPAVVAINASFFDTEGRAMGLAVPLVIGRHTPSSTSPRNSVWRGPYRSRMTAALEDGQVPVLHTGGRGFPSALSSRRPEPVGRGP